MRVSVAVIAKHASIDTGELEVSGVFNAAPLPIFPAGVDEFFLALRLVYGPDEPAGQYPGSVGLQRPDGTTDLLGEFTVSVKPEGLSRYRPSTVVIRQRGLTFREPGLHLLLVTVDKEQVAQIEIEAFLTAAVAQA
jgi:hypothetical protein